MSEEIVPAVPTAEGVVLKPEAIQSAAPTDETREERMKRLNLSDLPYHTYESEQAMKASHEEVKAKGDVPYEYKANGYTVTEVDDKDLPAKYKVTADGFEKFFAEKRDAEVYVETHAEAHKDLPATISK